MRKYYFEDDLILRTSDGERSLSHMLSISRFGLLLSDTSFPQDGFDYEIVNYSSDTRKLKIIGVDMI